MLALASASSAQNPTFILIVIGAVILVAFWRTILAVGFAALVIGFVFLIATGVLDVVHTLRALIP